MTSARPLTQRERVVKEALDAVRDRCDVGARLSADPVSVVHRYVEVLDRELVALVASSVAFGNVKAVRSKLEEVLAVLGAHPSQAADDPQGLDRALSGWRHRVFRGQDIARLLVGARRVQRARGSLGAALRWHLGGARDPKSLRMALATWCDEIRAAGGLDRKGRRRGPAHLLPDPRGASGCKRLLLLLRWMCRPNDGVDLGDWDIDPAILLIPVDVHVHRLSRNLGLTRRSAPSWATTEEVTRALARFAPGDPTGYDFSLCHLGMLQRCPSKRDESRCEGCGVKPVCIHWQDRAPRRRIPG